MRLVGIEEHVMRPGSEKSAIHLTEASRAKLHPSVEQRIANMDAAGISVQVLSLPVASPGLDWSAANPLAEVMPLDESSVPIAQGVNEELYQMVSKHPDRFSALATLPAGVPTLAAAELERAVRELGFVGAIMWGTIGDQFLDEPKFAPILETAARLDVPIYLHPGPPPKRISDIYYIGNFSPVVSAALGTVGYGWHYEVSLHVTRLIVSGVFDRIPGLKIIVGHLGEGLPFHVRRLERTLGPVAGLPKPISQYLTEHLWYTTSGYFFDEQFALTLAMFGEDRVVFSVDYPFEDNLEATAWFNRLALPSTVREKMAHGTVDKLFRLQVAG